MNLRDNTQYASRQQDCHQFTPTYAYQGLNMFWPPPFLPQDDKMTFL